MSIVIHRYILGIVAPLLQRPQNTTILSEPPQEQIAYCNIPDNLNYEASHADNFA